MNLRPNLSMSRPALTRRTLLRGAGVSFALPLLDAMAPARHAHAAQPPVRAAFLYVPNGVIMNRFVPDQFGPGHALPTTLEPLAPYRKDLTYVSGLAQKTATSGPDGPGDHARAMACFLTGARPLKTDGAKFRAGISVDQVAARRIGGRTRLPSLELGCETGTHSGACDSGYACVYSYNMAWAGPSTPLALETDPSMAFDRLFGVSPEVADSRRSLLDFIREDARTLTQSLGGRDRDKLEEYLSSTRELEQRLSRFRTQRRPPTGAVRPDHPPVTFTEHVRMMCDVIALAFQSDATRVITFALASEGSERTFSELNVDEGHHTLSHHQNDPQMIDQVARIDLFYVEQFAYLLGKLSALEEHGRPLLDSSMILYGSGISDGNRHEHHNLPILIAGRGGGALQPGRHVRAPIGTPLNNLFLTMLARLGAPTRKLGDSTGLLSGLA